MEKWKDIKGYKDIYQISDYGRVYSIPRRRVRGGLRKLQLRKDGYWGIVLMRNKKRAQFLVHRLVAKVFLRNKCNKPHINHIDGNKANNVIENLEWCTRKENQAHASKIGLYKKGEKHGASKLNNLQVRVIRHLDDITNDITQEKRWQRIGGFFGVSWTAVRDIVARKTWKHALN